MKPESFYLGVLVLGCGVACTSTEEGRLSSILKLQDVSLSLAVDCGASTSALPRIDYVTGRAERFDPEYELVGFTTLPVANGSVMCPPANAKDRTVVIPLRAVRLLRVDQLVTLIPFGPSCSGSGQAATFDEGTALCALAQGNNPQCPVPVSPLGCVGF